MSSKYSPKGSEWRRWDLHIHTPDTKLSNSYGKGEDVWDNYIDFLEDCAVSAFGITDYFSADGYYTLLANYYAKYPDTKKAFFLNIELRLAEAISAKSANPHIHVIFDNDVEKCSKSKIETFLSALKTLAENDDGVKISCADLVTKTDYQSASVTIDGLKDALRDTFGDSKPYLIAFPAKNDGVRSTDNSSPRKILITDKIDKMSDIFFGDSGNKDYFLRSSRYEKGVSNPKPVVSGSDSHSFADLERLEGNVAGFEPTWIKCDLTFRGLQQICFEPSCRVFIGEEPPVESRKLNQATKFLSLIQIYKVTSYDGVNGIWFDDVNIPLNPELTVIVGNKGSGKSALVDIIGLLGESRQEEYFSFLSDKGANKKFKQRGYAENFSATLTWQSGFSVEKNLNDKVDRTKPEHVRYLPQNYFEQLTNEIEIEEFRKEIEDVVFSHVEETDRMGLSSFSELQEFKTQQCKHEISALKSQLEKLNIDITECEEKSDPSYRKELEEEIKAKLGELSSLEQARPKEESKPDSQSPEQKRLSDRIELLTEKRDRIGVSGKQTTEALSERKSRSQKLNLLLQNINTLDAYLGEQREELLPVCEELGLDINQILGVTIRTNSIRREIEKVAEEIRKLQSDNQVELKEDFDSDILESIPDLRKGYKYINDQIEELKKQQGTAQRKYQLYLERLAKWNAQKVELLGDEQDPKIGSIGYIKKKLDYIDSELGVNLARNLAERKSVVRKIFESKEQVLSFYSELKNSVEERLHAVRTNDFSVNIDASFVLSRLFIKEFLGYIKKNRRGYFHGSNDPEKSLANLVGEVNWNDFESVYKFCDVVIEKLKTHDGEVAAINDQIVSINEFYDYLFSLGYFSPRYELRLGGKNLNELSPGEKGLLLLVFYLQLDRDNTPLVIDQPEDNLDNESIFSVLAHCIRDAKKNRQVVLVTHNPNLAVGADAEQIVYVKLNKSDGYKFSFESGSIENPRINQKIVDILEGTQPAFIKRRMKYQI